MWGIFRFFKNLFQNNRKITEHQKQPTVTLTEKEIDKKISFSVENINLDEVKNINGKDISQTEKVRLHLLSMRSINTWDAEAFYNAKRLSSIICRLRRRGMNIKTSKIKVDVLMSKDQHHENLILYFYTPEVKK